jgi:hypothetical protein
MVESIRRSHSGHEVHAAYRRRPATSLPKLMVVIAETIALDLLIIAGLYLVLRISGLSPN